MEIDMWPCLTELSHKLRNLHPNFTRPLRTGKFCNQRYLQEFITWVKTIHRISVATKCRWKSICKTAICIHINPGNPDQICWRFISERLTRPIRQAFSCRSELSCITWFKSLKTWCKTCSISAPNHSWVHHNSILIRKRKKERKCRDHTEHASEN